MTSKEIIIRLTTDSVDSLFSNARAMPVDRLTWEVAAGARTPLQILQECAQAPMWAVKMLTDRAIPDFSPDAFQEALSERAQWDSVDMCEQVCRERIQSLIETIRDFPEEDMEKTLFLPFTQQDHPYWDLMMYPYWNNIWHTGQLAFVQTLYGDKDMH